MPRFLRYLGVALLQLWLVCCGNSAQAQWEQDAGEPTRATDFHDALSPYGEWLDIQAYGRVWRPSPDYVGDDFVPYLTGGQWLYSEYGWYFSSVWDDQFGWAVFHYGRWAEDREYGWLWFPDVRWAASWVEWNSDDSYVAWYPSAPSSLQVTVSWIVVPAPSFAAPDVARFVPKVRPKLMGRPAPPPRGTATATLLVRGRPPLVVGRPVAHGGVAPRVHAGSVPPRGASPNQHTAAPVMRATPPSGAGHSFRASPPGRR